MIVTNISDLTPAMRTALLEGHAGHVTAAALTQRGLASIAPRGENGHYGLLLTEAGRRAYELLAVTVEAPKMTTAQAIVRANPALGEVARMVAQLRRWANEAPDAEFEAGKEEWNAGCRSTFGLIANQLERNVLGDLAPLLMPEAIRLDAELAAKTREG